MRKVVPKDSTPHKIVNERGRRRYILGWVKGKMEKASRQFVLKLCLIAAATFSAALALWLFPTLSPKPQPFCLVRNWKAHKICVTSLAFFLDGQRLISASWDGTVRFWKVNEGTKIDEIHFGRSIRFANFSLCEKFYNLFNATSAATFKAGSLLTSKTFLKSDFAFSFSFNFRYNIPRLK